MKRPEAPIESVLKGTLSAAGNASTSIVIPIGVLRIMGWKQGDIIDVDVFEGKHGKFVAMWNFEQQKKEYEDLKVVDSEKAAAKKFYDDLQRKGD